MSFADAISTCLRKYATFSGRARRSEYWWFALAAALVSLLANGLDAALDVNFIAVVAALGLLLPQLAVTVRRLHDTGRSGGWWFIALVPLVGAIVLLVFACQDSAPDANAYGESPKASALTPTYV